MCTTSGWYPVASDDHCLPSDMNTSSVYLSLNRISLGCLLALQALEITEQCYLQLLPKLNDSRPINAHIGVDTHPSFCSALSPVVSAGYKRCYSARNCLLFEAYLLDFVPHLGQHMCVSGMSKFVMFILSCLINITQFLITDFVMLVFYFLTLMMQLLAH